MTTHHDAQVVTFGGAEVPHAAGRTVTGSTLDDLAGIFGLANPAKPRRTPTRSSRGRSPCAASPNSTAPT